MPHRFLNFDSLLGDIVFFVSLQIMSFEIDNNLKLQIAGLLGSVLAVRTIDGKIGVSDAVKVAFSGMVLANFSGFFWCEYRNIVLTSHRAFFSFFIIGYFSDIVLRGVRVFGGSVVSHVPALTQSAVQKFKDFFLK